MIQLAFWGFAGLTILGALAVLLTRNVLYAAFCLLLTLLGVAGLFVLASADFLAVAQIMIYVGGVLVLVIFGVMLTHKPASASPANSQQPNSVIAINRPGSRPGWLIGLAVAGGLFTALYTILQATNFTLLLHEPFMQTTVGAIGIQLMTEYSFPFEVVGILLLAALVGAAYLSSSQKTARENNPY